MAEDSAFWGGTTVGDAASADIWKAPYTSEEWSDIWSKMFASDSTSGFVIPLHDNELAVEAESPVSMDVSVLSGTAFVKGRLYENTATTTLTIAANASGNPRIDRIILRTSFAAQTIRLAVLQGTPGATPTLPALTQDANTWEVSLAYIWVANGAASIANEEIHDERLFLKTSLSHKYEAGSQNFIKNSEFMGFSELSGGATTNPPDGWSLEGTPSDIASATKYTGMPRGRAAQITTDAALEGIYQSVTPPTNAPYSLKLPVLVTAGDVGVVKVPISYSLTSYASSNQDVGVPLRGPSGAGAQTVVDNTGATDGVIGDLAGTEYWHAQTLKVTAGRLSQITIYFGPNTGSPTGDLTWQICANGGAAPSTVLQSGTHTITPSADNTITITNGVYLAAATTYWLVFYVPDQASNTYFTVKRTAASVYADGTLYTSTNHGASWTSNTYDHRCSVTTSSVSVGDKLSQSFQIDEALATNIMRLYLKKTGAPVGTMTLRVETNNAGSPSGNLVDAAATTTLSESSLTTSYAWTDFSFTSSFSLSAATTYWIVLSTDRVSSGTNYVVWGSDASAPSYTSGEMKSEATGSWSAESKDSCFEVAYNNSTIKYIRRTGSFVEELLHFPALNIAHQLSIQLLGLNNGDVIQFGQCLLLEGRHPGPFREIHETILFKDGITDTNWAADAKSDGTTTIDLDADFQALVLPGTRQVLVGLIAQETTNDVLTYYDTSNQNAEVAAGVLAQSFQIGASSEVDRVVLYLKNSGFTTTFASVSIRTNSGGSPSGTILSQQSVFTAPISPTTFQNIKVDLPPVNLTNATTYWLVYDYNGSSGVVWGADSSAPSYASGLMKSFSGGTWNLENKDACFKILASSTLTSYLAARYVGGSKDYVKVSCESAFTFLDYYEQGWVKLNPNNQFDLFVQDTTANSITCSVRILGITI